MGRPREWLSSIRAVLCGEERRAESISRTLNR